MSPAITTRQGQKKAQGKELLAALAQSKRIGGAFCREWQAVLNQYKVPYFHFYEWATASAVARGRPPSSDFSKNPYQHLDLKQLDALLVALAKIAGSGNKIIIGGSVYTRLFHQAKISGDIPQNADPYRHCMEQFFAAVLQTIETQRPPWKRLPISFFFDQTDNREWICAFHDTFNIYRKKYSTFKEISFADKKDEPHLPLQAADMVAYRMRQIGEKWIDKKPPSTFTMIDEHLFKTTFDYLDRHKKEVFRAFLAGKLDYDYWEKK
jgi:hypothetical protein